MKKLFSIVGKLSAKRFAELHSDWPKLLFGSHALILEITEIQNAFNPILQRYPNKMRGSAWNPMIKFHKIGHLSSVP